MKTKFYNVKIVPEAQRQIRALDGVMLPKVISCLKMLAEDPYPPMVEKLEENPNFWRLTIDGHKIIYTIAGQQQTVIVCVVAKRNETYLEISSICESLMERHAASDNVVPMTAQSTRH